MLLSCTYVNDFCFFNLCRHLTHSFFVVPALSSALTFSNTDIPLPNAHLFDVLLKPSRHTYSQTQQGVVTLQLPLPLDVAELL